MQAMNLAVTVSSQAICCLWNIVKGKFIICLHVLLIYILYNDAFYLHVNISLVGHWKIFQVLAVLDYKGSNTCYMRSKKVKVRARLHLY